jgi:Fe-S-cluster containining protein
MDEVPPSRPAGELAAWLEATRVVIRDEATADVACEGCTACCESSQFVHIAPDETDALARIPAALLFPAPGSPGHMLLGYDEHGRCPMLVDGRCSIYAHRPRTCRTYDCRVFAAAGVDCDKPRIAERARQWRPTSDDQVRQLRQRPGFHGVRRSSAPWVQPTRIPVRAVAVWELLIDGEPTVGDVRAALGLRRRRDASSITTSTR